MGEHGEMVKLCTGCGEDLPVEAFAWKRLADGVRHSRCKECNRTYQQKWYSDNREGHQSANRAARARRQRLNRSIVEEAKSRPCADCGATFTTAEMDFDHVRGVKSNNVADMVWNATPDRLRAEISKCDVVCAVCHRIRTHGDGT